MNLGKFREATKRMPNDALIVFWYDSDDRTTINGTDKLTVCCDDKKVNIADFVLSPHKSLKPFLRT